jgi:hypothetical protein
LLLPASGQPERSRDRIRAKPAARGRLRERNRFIDMCRTSGRASDFSLVAILSWTAFRASMFLCE